jgi:hypothetical protein
MISMPDWANVEWDTILGSPESSTTNNDSNNVIDWQGMEWTSEGWQDFLNNVTNADATTTFSVCPIVELAMGIGEAFGIAGGCTCVENGSDAGVETSTNSPNSFLQIQCGFQDLCLEDGTTPSTTGDDGSAAVCASAGLNFTVEQGTGAVSTSVCLDFTDDVLAEVCFSYQLDVGSDNLAQSCSATYGGKACQCQIGPDDLCLLVDCSAYLPGAKIDSCQQLSFVNTEDALSLVPQFDVFDGFMNGTFVFDSVDWNAIDWNNIDWMNFGFDQVNWTSMDWPSLTWGSVFSNITDSVDICPILSEEVLGMEEEIVNSCTCSGDLASGFNVRCSFEKQCTGQAVDDGVVAIAREGTSSLIPSRGEICGDVVLDLGFEDTVGSVKGNLCVDFAEDIHPTTCIQYSIPIADLTSLPTCTATYGSQPCQCVIDENLCVAVDCSEYEETAVMDQCQILSVQETNTDVQSMLVPKFGVPSAAVTDVEGTNDEQVSGDNSSGGSTATNELKDGGVTSFSSRALVFAMGMVTLVLALAI